MDNQLLSVNTVIWQYFWLWADKCKWLTLIYLRILLRVYLKSCQTFKMELFAKMVTVFQPLEEVNRTKNSKLAVIK